MVNDVVGPGSAVSDGEKKKVARFRLNPTLAALLVLPVAVSLFYGIAGLATNYPSSGSFFLPALAAIIIVATAGTKLEPWPTGSSIGHALLYGFGALFVTALSVLGGFVAVCATITVIAAGLAVKKDLALAYERRLLSKKRQSQTQQAVAQQPPVQEKQAQEVVSPVIRA